MDYKFEVTVIPVSDVDRAVHFYKTLGWRFDAEFADDEGYRLVAVHPDRLARVDHLRQRRLDTRNRAAPRACT